MFAPKITFGNWRKHARTAASAEANHMIPFYFPSLSASSLTIRTYELHNDHTTYTIHVIHEQCRRKKKIESHKIGIWFFECWFERTSAPGGHVATLPRACAKRCESLCKQCWERPLLRTSFACGGTEDWLHERCLHMPLHTHRTTFT